MKEVNKRKIIFVALTLHDNVAIYSVKSHLIISLLSSFISPRDEQCFPFYLLSFTTYSICTFTCSPSSSILLGVLFVRFSRIFTVPLTPPVSITIAAPLSLIFSPRTIISGRLSPLFLAVFRFYLFSSFSFSHWHFIFILLPYFCRSFILIFSTCTVLITVLINVFLFKFLSFEKICLTFVFIYLMIRILRRTATLDFAHISRRVSFTFFMSLTSRLLPLNQFHRLRSHILFSRFFSSDKRPDLK